MRPRLHSFCQMTDGGLQPGLRLHYYCCCGLSLKVELMGFPMMSPDTIISTRRLSCRPAALSFEATGCVFPSPRRAHERLVTISRPAFSYRRQRT